VPKNWGGPEGPPVGTERVRKEIISMLKLLQKLNILASDDREMILERMKFLKSKGPPSEFGIYGKVSCRFTRLE